MNDSASRDRIRLLDSLVRQAGTLYTLPRVAMQVIELTNHPKVDARQLKQCIENDPALTAKILKVVNSSLLGLSREVHDLNQALALLGIKPLKLLVLGFSLPEKLFTDVSGDILERYWQHTLTKAVAAREIVQAWANVSGDEYFIAGLLQDLGMLVLLQQLGTPYADFLRKACKLDVPLLDLERRTLGFDHTELSSRLLTNWHLPEELSQGVIAARPCPLASAAMIARVLQMAELVARLLVQRQSSGWLELVAMAESEFQVAPDRVKDLLADLQEKVRQLADVLSLRIAGVDDYRAIVEQAHRQMAAVAQDLAGQVFRQQQKEQREVRHLLRAGELPEADSLVAAANQYSQQVDTLETLPGGEPVVTAAEPVPRSGKRRGYACPDGAPAAAQEANIESEPPKVPTAPAARAQAALVADAESEDTSTLAAQLSEAIAWCRQQRVALSLMLAEVDDYPNMLFRVGAAQANRIMLIVEAACRKLTCDGSPIVAVRDGCLALMLLDCERREAVEVAHRLLSLVRELNEHVFPHCGIGMSVGIAAVSLPSKNLRPEDLIEPANRCLFAAAAGGGEGIKSIEL